MFQKATRMYSNLLCNMGGGDSPQQAKLGGYGCLLTPDHVITANHCLTAALREHSFPVALTGNALRKAMLIWRSEEYDVCVLHLQEVLHSFPALNNPQVYPTDFERPAELGNIVGYLSAFHRADESGEENRYTFFSCAPISFLASRGCHGPRFALASGFIESGVSGSPVFLPCGAFVGVVVQSQEIPITCHDSTVQRVRFPVFSAIRPVAADIRHAIAR